MKHRVLTGTALAGAMLLAACSGEPGISDIKSAMKESGILNGDYRMAKLNRTTTARDIGEFVDQAVVEKGKCVSGDTAPGYVCGIRIGIIGGQPGEFTPWLKARIFDANGKWAMELVQ